MKNWSGNGLVEYVGQWMSHEWEDKINYEVGQYIEGLSPHYLDVTLVDQSRKINITRNGKESQTFDVIKNNCHKTFMICTLPLSWNVISVFQGKKITTEPCKTVVGQFLNS